MAATSRILGVIFFVFACMGTTLAADYRMMTGPQAGSWYPLGGAISNFVRKQTDEFKIQVLPGGGVTNVLAVERDKAQFAMGNVVSTVDGLAGRPPFRKPADNLTNIATFYPQVFQIVVSADSEIETIADLKGKKLSVGLRGYTGEQMSRHVLQVYGLTYDDMDEINYVGYTDSVALFKDGHIDCFLVGTTVPAGVVMDVSAARNVKLLQVSEEALAALQDINSQYVTRIIEPGTYADQDHAVRTFGTWTHLMANREVPDDVAYGLTKAIAENRETMKSIVKALDGVTIEILATDVGVPLHPGAARYYKEQGVLP